MREWHLLLGWFGRNGTGVGWMMRLVLVGGWLGLFGPEVLRGEERGRMPLEIVFAEGELTVSDGISLFTFREDGTFAGVPLREGGRTMAGRWKVLAGQRAFEVAGEWTWTDKYAVRKDFRTMTFSFISIAERRVHYKKGTAYESEFRISDIRAKAQ